MILGAICFRCGAGKETAEVVCPACAVRPETEEDLATSIALSSRFSKAELLTLLSAQLQARRTVDIPDAVMARAREMVRAKRTAARERTSAMAGAPLAANKTRLPPTELHRNAFAVIGATLRDSERRLVELVEERSVSDDADSLGAAANVLRNPRTRLQAEVGWLPGVAPGRATELLYLLRERPAEIRAAAGLPALARANLLASALEGRRATMKPDEWGDWILDLCRSEDAIRVDDVFRDINEDRAVAQIPLIRSKDAVESELAARRDRYRSVAHDCLNALDSTTLCSVATQIVTTATSGEGAHTSAMVDDLAIRYETSAAAALEKGAMGVETILAQIRRVAPHGEPVVLKSIEPLKRALSRWDRIAQPIQVAAKARGQRHALSESLAGSIRGLSKHLWDEHSMLSAVQALTSLMRDVFAEVPVWAETLEEDRKALAERAAERQHAGLLTALRERCDEIGERTHRDPKEANREAMELLDSSPRICEDLQTKGAPVSMIGDARDYLAMTVRRCVVEYCEATSFWSECIVPTQRAIELAASKEVKQRLQEDLIAVQNNAKRMNGLKPIEAAPSLGSVNGIGATIYGASDRDPETGSYLTTYYFIFFFIPVLPIARYRVIAAGNNSYRFIGKAALRTFDKLHIAGVVIGILWLMFSN
jgi:hypothetical protein